MKKKNIQLWSLSLQIFSKCILKKNVSWVLDRNKPFKCDICDYRSSRKSDLNKHVASVHEVNKPFKYDMCDHRCSQKSHSKKCWVGPWRKEPFKCDICDYRYSQKSHMIRHAASVHEGKKPFNVKFATRAVL